MPNVMKSGRLNLLKPSGPHRACYGSALPLPLSFIFMYFCYAHGNPVMRGKFKLGLLLGYGEIRTDSSNGG